MTNRRRPRKVALLTGRTAPDAPKKLTGGKVRCPGCFAAVSLTPNGHLRAHKAPNGDPCAHRAYGKAVELAEVPPVVFPRGHQPPVRQPATDKTTPSRVVTGHCHECDRAVSGERQFCGQCLRKRGRL